MPSLTYVFICFYLLFAQRFESPWWYRMLYIFGFEFTTNKIKTDIFFNKITVSCFSSHLRRFNLLVKDYIIFIFEMLLYAVCNPKYKVVFTVRGKWRKQVKGICIGHNITLKTWLKYTCINFFWTTIIIGFQLVLFQQRYSYKIRLHKCSDTETLLITNLNKAITSLETW